MRKVIYLTVLTFILVSCEKENLKTTSNLTIEFKGINNEEIADMRFSLYDVNYTSEPLYEDLKPNSDGIINIQDLNAGTYRYTHPIVTPCSGYCWRNLVFQLNEGKDKTITITDY